MLVSHNAVQVESLYFRRLRGVCRGSGRLNTSIGLVSPSLGRRDSVRESVAVFLVAKGGGGRRCTLAWANISGGGPESDEAEDCEGDRDRDRDHRKWDAAKWASHPRWRELDAEYVSLGRMRRRRWEVKPVSSSSSSRRYGSSSSPFWYWAALPTSLSRMWGSSKSSRSVSCPTWDSLSVVNEKNMGWDEERADSACTFLLRYCEAYAANDVAMSANLRFSANYCVTLWHFVWSYRCVMRASAFCRSLSKRQSEPSKLIISTSTCPLSKHLTPDGLETFSDYSGFHSPMTT